MREATLANLITNKKIIIVGPSPHLTGKNMGSFIDSFDVVVRINELGISKDYFIDYGSRTDVAFLSLSEQSLRVYKKMLSEVYTNELKIIVHPRDEYNINPYSEESFKTRNTREIYDDIGLSVDYFHISHPSFFERCNLFGVYPTTGALAIQEILNYDFKSLYICGFSFYTTKNKWNEGKKNYMKVYSSSISEHNIRKPGHDINKEVQGLKKLISENNRNIFGDILFERIILSKSNIYFKIKQFLNYYVNIDNFKNLLKLAIRKLKLK